MAEQPNLFQDGFSEEYANYLVHSRREITQILRGIKRQNEIVTGYFNQGSAFFLSAILDADPDRGFLLLDCGSDSETNRRALASNKFIFVTNLNHIKIQFSTTSLEQVEFEGRPAFRTPLPINLLKLQRREYYRLQVPIRANLRCIIPDLAGERLEVDVVDISLGGVAISGFPNNALLEKGLLLPDCRIVLPDEGMVVAGLEVRNLFETNPKAELAARRIGCLFVGIPAPHQAMIQRYIIRVDRERRALIGGGS